MTVTTLLAYAGALFIAAAIPGPGMTAIVARALGSGFRPTFFMGLGLILGDLCYLSAVVLGLSYVAQTLVTPFLVIKYAGAAYLGYIAYKLWTAGLLPQEVQARKGGGVGTSFLSGLFVTLGNPKAARARTLLKQPSALKLLNRAAGSILASTAAYIAVRAA